MTLDVGDRVPDFTLPATIAEEITLSEVLEERPVVLIFYLLDFSGDDDSG